MWGYHEGFGWWMMFGGMSMVVFWAAIIGLAVWGVNRLGGDRAGRNETGDTPVEIAKKRLASGKITIEEFEEMQKVF